MATFLQQSKQNTNPELNDPKLFLRDSRTLWMRLKSGFNQFFPLILVLCGLALLAEPQHGDFIFAFAVGIRLLNTRKDSEYPFDAPEWERFICRESLRDAVSRGHLLPQRKMGKGTLIFGREYLRRRLLVSNPDMETRHTLILGSTGSGKTVLILTLLYQALLQPGGTSAVVVDGKADISLFWTIFAILKRLDRLHDFLVLNFLTPMDCLDTRNMHDDDRISNNMNILNSGTPDQMKTITMGLGRQSEGGDASFWEGRSSTMMGASYQYLAYERDVEGLDINIEVVRDFLVVKNMIKVASRKDVHIKYRRPLQQYLKTLPGISEQVFSLTEQEIDKLELYSKADEQHTYNVMMVSETMSDLSDTMGHIFVTKLSEVNMTDVCLGGRVLLVLLPSIAKNQDSVAALGRLLLQGLRPILMRAAGYQLQGNRITTLENRPSSASYPVRLFLDEYGMYGVKGFYVIVSLVRSYGFHVLFGAQTAGMFERACGRQEYEALIGNLNNKFILKNEDHGESLNLAMGRTGKVYAAKQDRIKTSANGATYENESRIEERDMLSARMLASAEPGEGIYVFGGEVYPFRVMHLNFPKVDTAKLNFFSQVLDPTYEEVEDVKRQCLLHSTEYVVQANQFVETEMELLETKELSACLEQVKGLNITENISKRVMLSVGLSILNSQEQKDSVENKSELDSNTYAESEQWGEQQDESYVTDAELQIMEAQDAYLEDFEEEGSVDYSDFEAYLEIEMNDMGVPDIDGSHAAMFTETDHSTIDLSVFDNDAFSDLEEQYKQRYVSSNLNSTDLQSAIDNGQAEIGESLSELLMMQGHDETQAVYDSQCAVEQIKSVLSYPNSSVRSEPLSSSEVEDVVSKTLQSLGSRF